MALFFPTAAVNRVTDITLELLQSMGVNAVLLDVDNTLSCHGSQIPLAGSIEWRHRLAASGIKMVIMSNNFKRRVKPFAAKYGLPFITMSLKPFPFAYWRAIRKLGSSRKQAVVVGDQVFTDVLGANLAGVKSILLVPIQEESGTSFRIRRKLEKRIREKIRV